jgi:hypothetical protein
MTRGLTRRGVLGSLVAALLGLLRGPRATAAAAPPAPPRCAHYYDGVLWCALRPGRSGYYHHNPEGCPYCPTEGSSQTPLPPTSFTCAITHTYDVAAGPIACNDLTGVATYTYDGRGGL